MKHRLLHDPIFYIGILFFILLAFQCANNGLGNEWDNVAGAFMPHLPSKWVPWSANSKSALQMFFWFFPAWTAVLVVRHGLDRGDLLRILYLMVWNASLLAGLGIVQYLVGAKLILGRWEIPGGLFFATFDYVNHAGAWFYLHAAVAAGLAFRALWKRMPSVQVVVWCGCFLLCISATFFTLSRAAAVAGTLLMAGFSATLFRWAWHRAGNHQAIQAVGLACIVILGTAILFLEVGGGQLRSEIKNTLKQGRLAASVEDRAMQLPWAWAICKDYPLFGCGGGGYREMAPFYIPRDELSRWRGMRKSHVHCDPLQFLCEFGWVGVLLMAGALGTMVRGIFVGWRSPMLMGWILAGLLLVFMHSWFDFLFRSPAILIAWCMLLAMFPIFALQQEIQ